MRVTDVVLETNAGRTRSWWELRRRRPKSRCSSRATPSGRAPRLCSSCPRGLARHVDGRCLQRQDAGALCGPLRGAGYPLMVHAIKSMDVPFFETLLERFPQVKYIKRETSHGIKLRKYVSLLGDRSRSLGPASITPRARLGARGSCPVAAPPHSCACL